MKAKPLPPRKISFVITSRNDGTTGNEIDHMQVFVDSLLEQCGRFELDAELIIVEWNPPVPRPPLVDELDWSRSSPSCPVRIVQVPHHIHDRFPNSDMIPLFQMIAKNVGIRRAHGRFVLATNIDVLFSNELMQFFALGKLKTDRMYRIDRYDVRANIPVQVGLDERLEWCRRNLLRVYRSRGTVQAQEGMIPPPEPTAPIPAFLTRLKSWWNMQFPLHTNACGDFTMLSSRYWEKMRGYAEFPIHAMKLDALLCYAAHFAGAREALLEEPLRIYHVDHPARSDGALLALAKRDSDSQSLQLPLDTYRSYVKRIQRSFRPVVFNDAGWGLAGEDLPETVIASATGDKMAGDLPELRLCNE